MKRLLAFLFLSGVAHATVAALPQLTSEEKNVTTVLMVYLRENKDPKAVEAGAPVLEYAAAQRDIEEQARARYAHAIKENGGYKLDGDSVKRLADGGNAMAELKLAIGYAVDQNSEEGIYGLPRDEQQSVFWATKAALHGIARAQWILAMREDTRFDERLYWLTRVAAHSSIRCYQHAAALLAMKENLNNATPEQFQQLKDLQKSFSNAESLAANSLVMLFNLRHGKTAWGDRSLTADEARAAAKFFGR